MQTQATIIDLARLKHQQLWTSTSDVSTQTKSSGQVCRAWQQAVQDNFRQRFSSEHAVGPGMNEKIDLVELQDRVAYELKVSENNTHFEFYRDIFKIAVHNHVSPRDRLTRLVFIKPEAGARTLASAYGRTVVQFAGQFGIEIIVAGI
jgi:hypothetical protein